MILKKTAFVIAALLAPLPAAAVSWPDAIAATEAKAEDLWQLAQSRGLEGRHIGTLYNEWHSDEHTCSILGRMLGKADMIAEIERSTEIDVSQTDGQETGVAARSLGNWAFIARRLLDSTDERRIREWNLDCVGYLGIPDSAYINEGGASAFYDVEEATLRVIGNVEQGFADKLKAVILDNPKVKYVALGSGGGSVAEAIEAGLFIRESGLNTLLWNNCYSACTIVFIAGVNRQIWSPYPDLSFHQVSRDGVAIPLDDPSYHKLAAYAAYMGVNARTFLELTWSAPPSAFVTPHVDILCAAKIATWVQRRC